MTETQTSPVGEEETAPSGRGHFGSSVLRARRSAARPVTADVATIYLLLALVWGFALVGLVPPFQVPDEPAHFYRAWELAQLDYQADMGGLVLLPKSVATLPTDVGSVDREWSHSSYSPKRFRQYLLSPIGDATATVDNASRYGPLGYLPHMLPIEVARLAGRGALAALYGARMLNLLTAVLLTYLAIRVVPAGKLLIAVIGLLPMTMYETASASPDALTIAGALLFAGLLLRAMSRASLEVRDIAILAATGALGLNVKPGYALLVVAVLALPKTAFGSRRRYLASMAAILGATAGLAGLLMFTTPRGAPAALERMLGPNNGVDPGRQLEYVLHDPWGFARVILYTFDWSGDFLLKGFVGHFGWLTIALPFSMVFLGLVALVIAFSSSDDYSAAWWQRAILVCTAALPVIATSLVLYLTFSPFGSPTIAGLQGRYFIPCAPFFLFGLYGLRVDRAGWRLVVFYGLLAILAAATIITIARFYYL
jgi:Predicted membrane protein (DUF2142)